MLSSFVRAAVGPFVQLNLCDFSAFLVHCAGSSQSKGRLLLNLTLIVPFFHDQTGVIHESSSGMVDRVLV